MDNILNTLNKCNPLRSRRQREGYHQLNEVHEPTEQTTLLPNHQRNTEIDEISAQDPTDRNTTVAVIDQGAKEKDFRTREGGYRSCEIEAKIEKMETSFFGPSKDKLLVKEIKEFANQHKRGLIAYVDKSERAQYIVERALGYKPKKFKKRLENIEEKMVNKGAENLLKSHVRNTELVRQKAKERLLLGADLIEHFWDRLTQAIQRFSCDDPLFIPRKEDGEIDSDALYEYHLQAKGRLSEKTMKDIYKSFRKNYDNQRLFELIKQESFQSRREIDLMASTCDYKFTEEEESRLRSYDEFTEMLDEHFRNLQQYTHYILRSALCHKYHQEFVETAQWLQKVEKWLLEETVPKLVSERQKKNK